MFAEWKIKKNMHTCTTHKHKINSKSFKYVEPFAKDFKKASKIAKFLTKNWIFCFGMNLYEKYEIL